METSRCLRSEVFGMTPVESIVAPRIETRQTGFRAVHADRHTQGTVKSLERKMTRPHLGRYGTRQNAEAPGREIDLDDAPLEKIHADQAVQRPAAKHGGISQVDRERYSAEDKSVDAGVHVAEAISHRLHASALNGLRRTESKV